MRDVRPADYPPRGLRGVLLAVSLFVRGSSRAEVSAGEHEVRLGRAATTEKATDLMSDTAPMPNEALSDTERRIVAKVMQRLCEDPGREERFRDSSPAVRHPVQPIQRRHAAASREFTDI